MHMHRHRRLPEEETCALRMDWDYGAKPIDADAILKAAKFPPGFVWGTSTSAYQIEGSTKADGRGDSIWDAFAKKGKIANNDTGDVACDHYKRYKEDVALMKELGYLNYRFSIAWPRVIPDGEGDVNEAGLDFYSNLVDELIANNITPCVTLYHWDLPLALEEKYGGWLSNKTADLFVQYADVVFARLGDRVKTWTTLNEPLSTAVYGYGMGVHAPGEKDLVGGPYIAGHNQLIAHAKAVNLYRSKYQDEQGGRIGIVLNTEYKERACDTKQDAAAAERSQVHTLAWFADPIYFGDYPDQMKELVEERLPVFTDEEKALLKGSADFFGLNHYTTHLVYKPGGNWRVYDYWNDAMVLLAADPKWPGTALEWLHEVPWGFRRLLVWIKKRYDNPPIMVLENGMPEKGENNRTGKAALEDKDRQRFLKSYVAEMYQAIEQDKVNVTGYFVWSLLDNFEWADGYPVRFGLVHVNYTTQERTPKESAKWYSDLIKAQS